MIATISWWDLSDSTETIETLNSYLNKGAVTPWNNIQGLFLKVWIYNHSSNLWGAIMFWENSSYARAPLPPNRATELIGYPPTLRIECNTDAVVGSLFSSGENSDLKQTLFGEEF